LPIQNAGAHLQGFDLQIAGGYGLSPDEIATGYGVSVKAAFDRFVPSMTVRLFNSQGRKGHWDTGTIFAFSDIGLGYADAELAPGITKPAGDSRSLDVSVARLLELWGQPKDVSRSTCRWLPLLPVPAARPEFFIDLPMPFRQETPSTRLVSDPLARTIFESGRTPLLENNWSKSI
jgi:hypothetical protein